MGEARRRREYEQAHPEESRFHKMAAAQDAFTQLVEDCRLGTLDRISMNPFGPSYTPYKPDLDLSDLPVFWIGDLPAQLPDTTVDAGDAIAAGTFRAPYDRCAALFFAAGHHPAFGRVPYKVRGISRYSLVLVESHTDGLLLAGFIKPADRSHWGKQTWQALIRNDGMFELSVDPCVGDVSEEWQDSLLNSARNRVLITIGTMHRIMTSGGSATTAVGGEKTSRADALRNSLDLPAVSRLRVIRFDPPSPTNHPPTEPREIATIGVKAPHFRRGTWRNLASGRRIPVRACAIHGGGDAPPPWYEVRAPSGPASAS